MCFIFNWTNMFEGSHCKLLKPLCGALKAVLPVRCHLAQTVMSELWSVCTQELVEQGMAKTTPHLNSRVH